MKNHDSRMNPNQMPRNPASEAKASKLLKITIRISAAERSGSLRYFTIVMRSMQRILYLVGARFLGPRIGCGARIGTAAARTMARLVHDNRSLPGFS
jgi:hypothetical protein